MTLDEITKQGITPALSLLPANMDSPAARVMLLTIGLQESRFEARQQLATKIVNGRKLLVEDGPAKSFWQGERGGGMVAGVRTHEDTRKHAAKLYAARNVAPTNAAIWDAIEFDDVLAAGLARLLLWSDPKPLPTSEESAWQLYQRTWRPGAWTRGDLKKRAELRQEWAANFRKAQAYVNHR